MGKKNWIAAIVVAILGMLGIGTGVRKYRKKERERREAEERKKDKRDKLMFEIELNQLRLSESQQKILEQLEKMKKEMNMEIDPNEVKVEIDDDK